MDSSIEIMDKLSYEIFSILESRFLYGDSVPQTPIKTTPTKSDAGGGGKVRILSVDTATADSDGLLGIAASLTRLESSLRSRSGDPNARIADFFDVAAGSGTGGVIAAMLFTRGAHGRPLFSADEAFRFLCRNRIGTTKKGLFRGLFRGSGGGIFRRMFGESTLRDTIKPLLIPCYDLTTGAPFLFSRADAIETDGYDFKIRHVCTATCADRSPEMIWSADGKTEIAALGGGVAMGNPTAAAITHVLNNKMEFPFANGVEDLLVVSLGSVNGTVTGSATATPSTVDMIKIAGSNAADTVDQAVAMAFGDSRTSNYVRIQGNGFVSGNNSSSSRKPVSRAEEMMSHRNVESVLFQGKMISKLSNAEKLEQFSAELVKVQEKRRSSPIPTVMIKNQPMTPRLSSATVSTTFTSSSTGTSNSP